VSRLLSAILTQPSVQYRRNPLFYFQYDGAFFAVLLGLCGALFVSESMPLVTWQPWHIWLLPAVIYIHILANVCIHNCCHGNFPRAINRLVGEVLGLFVITRYASWEIIHQRHHRYSDDPEKDPHFVSSKNFWIFLYNTMLINVERQLQNIFYDQFGDTPQHRRMETWRAILSFGTMLPLVACWYLVLGPEAFWYLFVPANAVGWIHVAHFNWATHNAHDPNNDFKPVNLDHGFYWLGNRIWFGLYMHGNHHKRTNVFNPAKMEQVMARRAAARAAASEADRPSA